MLYMENSYIAHNEHVHIMWKNVYKCIGLHIKSIEILHTDKLTICYLVVF